MNILYLTKLTENPFSGTNNCIPEQIYAQSKIDNVFWLQLNHIRKKVWEKDTYAFHNIDSIEPKISKLPEPFNKPDLVIVQQFYDYPFSPIIAELQKKKIPYIIQPHGEFSKGAQNHKRIKKIIGNILWFNRMVKRSFAIEYLTENEYKNSIWKNKRHLVIPNGILLPEFRKKDNPLNGIRASFIGRLSIDHKGIDVLLEGVSLVKDELKKSNFILNMYGPDQNGSKKTIQEMIEKLNLKEVVFLNESVFGEAKNKILGNTDLFVLTSRREGHPIALLEALSYGIPCLVTPGTNMDKEVTQYNAGWCAEFDATAISKKLIEIVNSKNEFENKSVNARKLASVYSWDEIAKKAHSEYERILSDNSV